MKKYFQIPSSHAITHMWALFVLRVGLSALMLGHGYSKLEKLMNGDFAFPDPLGLGSQTSLLLAVFAEFFCSILLLVGFASRFVVVPLIITMITAVFIVHAGDSIADKELGLIYLFGYVSIILAGPGKLSLDYIIFGTKKEGKSSKSSKSSKSGKRSSSSSSSSGSSKSRH